MGVKRTILIATICLLTIVFMAGCGQPPKPRRVDLPAQIIGNWTVKDPPKVPVDPKMPKGYTPPEPTYNLTFVSEGTFNLTMNNTTLNGTFIISGATIQLIPTGKNYRFEIGAKEKDDRIAGDGLVWTRVTKGDYNPPKVPHTSSPTSTDNPTSTDSPDNPVSPPVTPPPIPDNPVPPPPVLPPN